MNPARDIYETLLSRKHSGSVHSSSFMAAMRGSLS